MSSSFHQSDLDLCYRRLSQSPNASVISWLDQCPYPTSPDQFDLTLDEQFFEVSETEPITAMYSPAKRPRNEGSDEGSGFTIARTPPPPIRRRPDLTRSPSTVPITTGVDESSQAPSSPRTSQNRSTGSNSRQQKTAVKKVLHLCSLDTPVRYRPSDEEALPIAIKALAQTIAAVSDSPGEILPNQTKGQDVQHPENKKDVADLFSKHVHAVLMEIVSATKEALVWNRSEAAWNLLVHYPMLKLAISGLPDVDVELITAAQILPAFLPKFTPPTTTRSTSKTSAEAVTSQGKMVDLALLLSPKRISSSILAAAMDAILPTLPLDECCLSQTDYGPLSVYPAPVAIETKTANGSMEEARIQLGIWTSAWFLRMHKLMREPKTAVVAVPVIMVQGPWWFAYFACETEQGIVLYGPQRLGETNTNYGIYTLFACLKSIGEWLDGPFKQWFAREILGLAKLD